MKTISTDRAPEALGPYSQGVMAGNTLYVSGQLGIDPDTGELQDGLAAQAEQVLANIAAIAAAAGLGLGDAVKLTVYLQNLDDFAELNAIFAASLGEPYPARACIEASRLPRGALLEIDAILVDE